VFVFLDKLYRQVSGHATGQKQATSVACICPGVVEFTFEFSKNSIIFLNTRLILNRDTKQIDVDYYVKPTNKQLFLHFRSCHPEHVFRATVYCQAMLGKTVCSYPEWCERYMQRLRVKFIEQEYPEKLIDEQFERVRKLSREQILYRKKDTHKAKSKAKEMRSCLVVTHNPANPPFHQWFKSLIGTLHEDPDLKKLCPKLPIITRQPPSVASFALKSKHWQKQPGLGPDPGSPGCHRLHRQNACVCCARMEEKTTTVRSTMTAREYKITRHYDCQSTWVVYVVTCIDCQVKYVGQTTQTMAARHYGHRREVRTGADGLGRHFLEEHGVGLDLSKKEDLATCLASFHLQVMGSVKPPATPEEEPACQSRLDRLEADLQKRLR
jgi:hypothetical protein